MSVEKTVSREWKSGSFSSRMHYLQRIVIEKSPVRLRREQRIFKFGEFIGQKPKYP